MQPCDAEAVGEDYAEAEDVFHDEVQVHGSELASEAPFDEAKDTLTETLVCRRRQLLADYATEKVTLVGLAEVEGRAAGERADVDGCPRLAYAGGKSRCVSVADTVRAVAVAPLGPARTAVMDVAEMPEIHVDAYVSSAVF